MTLAQALAWARGQGLAAIDAELLLAHILERHGDRAWLRAHDTDALPGQARARFEGLCLRRAQGEPLAYLVGRKEFFGLSLRVDARVLDPRPDTETLVDWALELCGPQPLTVADLGTGSGAIALALKHARPAWNVWAVDASAAALDVARANTQALGLAIELRQGSWMQGLPGLFDLVVSNPPYIADGDAHLPALRHEPRQALVAGADGLEDLRQIISQAATRLSPGGWLLLEHGHDQARTVGELLRAAGFSDCQTRRDLAGIERCSGGHRPCMARDKAPAGPASNDNPT